MDEIDLMDFLRAMIRRRRLIAAAAIAAALAAFVVLQFVPHTYRGKAVLLFPQMEQSGAAGLLGRLQGLPAIAELGMPVMNGPGMYGEILRSRTISQSVIGRLQLSGLDIEPEMLQKQIDIDITKDGGMEICCYAPSTWAESGKIPWVERELGRLGVDRRTAVLAARLTNTYVDCLKEFDRQHSMSTGRRHRVFLEGEVAKTRRQLADAEEALRRFREASPAVPLPDDARPLFEQVVDLRTKQIEAETELNEQQQSIRQAESIIAGQPQVQSAATVIQENPVVIELKSQLAQAEVRKAQLLEDRTEKHPDVVAADQEIAKVRDKIHGEVARITASETLQLNAVRQTLVGSLAELEIKKSGTQARSSALKDVMSRVERELSRLAKDQMELVRLAREQKALEMIYTSLVMELSQAKVAEAKEPEGFTVLDIATPENRRFRPRTKLTLLAAALLGMMVGGMIAQVQEGRRPRKRPAEPATAPQIDTV